MARHSIPRVIDDHLLPVESAHASFQAIPVGSEAWYVWLSQPATRSFAFHSPQGTLTCCRSGSWMMVVGNLLLGMGNFCLSLLSPIFPAK